MTTKSLMVRVGADTKDMERGLSSAQKKIKAFRTGINKIGRVMMVAGAAISGAVGMIVKKASDAEETFAKFGTVFNSVMTDAEEAVGELTDRYGLSMNAARDMLSSTGDLLTGLGMQSDVALTLSKRTQQLSVDLASFTNYQGGAKGASEALTKAMLGERESVKSLGIVITEEMVKEHLLREGKEKLTGQALLQAKAEATLAIAVDQSKNAIGDYERTSGSLANTTRRLMARLDDLWVTLGQKLVPVFAFLANRATEALENIQGNTGTFTTNMLVFFKAISKGVMGLMLAWNEFQRLVFEGAGLVTGHLRNMVAQIVKMFVVMEKLPIIGDKFRGVTDFLWESFKMLDVITQGYNETADATGERMATIIEEFEKLFAVIENVKGGLEGLKTVTTTTTEVLETKLGPASTEMWDTLTKLEDVHGEFVNTWQEKSKELSKSEAMAAEALQAAYYGGLEGMISYFEQLAIAALLKWVMTTVPFPANLIAAPIAMGAAKGLFKTIRSFEVGGFVPEETLAHLHPGEFVLNAPTVKALARPAREPRMGAFTFSPTVNIYAKNLDDYTISRAAEKIFAAMEREKRRRGI